MSDPNPDFDNAVLVEPSFDKAPPEWWERIKAEYRTLNREQRLEYRAAYLRERIANAGKTDRELKVELKNLFGVSQATWDRDLKRAYDQMHVGLPDRHRLRTAVGKMIRLAQKQAMAPGASVQDKQRVVEMFTDHFDLKALSPSETMSPEDLRERFTAAVIEHLPGATFEQLERIADAVKKEMETRNG